MYFLTFSDQNYFFAKTAGKSSQLRIIQNSLGARKEASRGRVLKHQRGTLSANISDGHLFMGVGSFVAPRSRKKFPFWPSPRGPRGHGGPFFFAPAVRIVLGSPPKQRTARRPPNPSFAGGRPRAAQRALNRRCPRLARSRAKCPARATAILGANGRGRPW